MNPLVSILIPAFNSSEWIADCIKSALAQTWSRKEIIVVDDGSTDRTLAIAQQFVPHGVTVISQTNQGVSAARNKAFGLCHGDYIQWLDGDDLLAPEKIARQMEALASCRSKRTLLSSAWGSFMYRLDRADFSPTPLWCDLSPVEWLLRKMGQGLWMQTATWLVSRELTDAAGPWDTRLWRDNDGEYFCRVLRCSDGVRFIPEAKVYHRRVGMNRLSYIGRSKRKLESLFLSMQLHIGYLRSMEDSERVRAACLAYLQYWLIDFYPERPDIVGELQTLAAELGGHLEPPRLRWKYAWIKPLFGWGSAKRVQFVLPEFRWWINRSWDRTMFHLQHGRQKCAPKPLLEHSGARFGFLSKMLGSILDWLNKPPL